VKKVVAAGGRAELDRLSEGPWRGWRAHFGRACTRLFPPRR
jgi:hypothetical protein